MNESKEKPSQYGEWLFTAIAIGFFLLLVGTLFVITPNLFDNILDFLKDFKLVDVSNTDIVFPAPEFPRIHLTVYQAVGQFSIAVCLFQIVLLALRFFVPSSWSKRAENVGNLVYWGGAAFLIQLFLIESTQWFVFWSTLIIIVGVSMIARAIVMAVSRI
ncbi:MAG: hypothetical protein E3J73_07170 [Candidatus Bathyarchaeum sp.]|nr:MAG: hypothetical protein E3J73_07170 [Candidatus Bathyarchaeum sp.]